MSNDKEEVSVDMSRAENWNKTCDDCGDKATSLWVKSHMRGSSLTELCGDCSEQADADTKAFKIGEYDSKVNIFGL